MRQIFVVLSVLALSCLELAAQTQGGYKTLDKRDLVTKEWNTDVATNVKFLDHETVYNSEGRKIQETEYSKLGKLWTKKYEYSPDGSLLRELTYNDRGKLDNIQKFEYNEFGKKKAVYTYDARGKLVKIKVIEYNLREHVE